MEETATKVYPIRMPAELYDAIQRRAESEDRSMNYRVVQDLASLYGLNVKPPKVGGKRVKGGASLTSETKATYETGEDKG